MKDSLLSVPTLVGVCYTWVTITLSNSNIINQFLDKFTGFFKIKHYCTPLQLSSYCHQNRNYFKTGCTNLTERS